MNLMGMSFKNFVWENNPVSLDIEEKRQVSESVIPFSEGFSRDISPRKRLVRGECYFTGENAFSRFRELESVFTEGGAGSLILPGEEPFLAVMESLTLIGAAGKNLVRCSFSFREVQGMAKTVPAGKHKVISGESLWDLSYRFGRDIDALIASNPQIEDIAELSENEEVNIP